MTGPRKRDSEEVRFGEKFCFILELGNVEGVPPFLSIWMGGRDFFAFFIFLSSFFDFLQSWMGTKIGFLLISPPFFSDFF